jgi:hypothetical protein
MHWERILDPLPYHRDPLTDTDAHRAQRVLSGCTMQLIHRRRGQARAVGSQRVAQRNRTAVGINARVVVLQAQVTQYR